MKNKNLVKLKFHGDWDFPTDWDLSAKSLGECLRLVQLNTQNKLYSTLLERDEKNIKYCIVINGRNFHTDKKLDINNPATIFESELAIKNDNLKTIDIIPVLEGSDSDIFGIFTAVVGVILIALAPLTGGLTLIPGLTLLAAGIFTLLSKPPKFEDFREIEQGGKTSYLFSGPQNVVGEGGPVPLGYGRLIVGSQVISAAYVTREFNVDNPSEVIVNQYGSIVNYSTPFG